MPKIKPTYTPQKCWVNNQQKVCHPDIFTAEQSARLIEQEHHLPPNFLHAYKCEYGNHYHLASSSPKH
ncbi:MAG: hypothetical protein LBT19_00030 [Candidatus Nomurabacteria bacterium]|nr:hypothetical protein [Candidatus Nomurabacteria bacterium]